MAEYQEKSKKNAESRANAYTVNGKGASLKPPLYHASNSQFDNSGIMLSEKIGSVVIPVGNRDKSDNANLNSFSMEANTLSIEAGITDEKASIGTGWNAVGADYSLGNSNSNDSNDGYVRLGVYLSHGAGLRLHYEDGDKDGLREFGFGLDFEIVSLDVQSEDPIKSAIFFLLFNYYGPIWADWLGGNESNWTYNNPISKLISIFLSPMERDPEWDLLIHEQNKILGKHSHQNTPRLKGPFDPYDRRTE